jgi:hypothetical protein
VKEQSHKTEMRDALRGDFERLRARLHDVSAPAAPVAVAPPVPERLAATPVAVAPPTAEPIDTPAAVPHVERVVEAVVDDDPPARSSWLDRLRNRR